MHRILRVETEPPGASVLLDGQPVGTTPLDYEFQYFGKREILVEKDGFERRLLVVDIDGRWYDSFPFDFFTEFLPLFPRTDIRTFQLKLRPAARTFAGETDPAKEKAAQDALMLRAQELRRWTPSNDPPKPKTP